VFAALLEVAGGAVKLMNKKWQDFDVLNSEELREPYPFEHTQMKRNAVSAEQQMGKGYLWAELSWPEIKERLQEVDLAIVPCGAIEQHGPHLPVDVDAFDAEYLARRAAISTSSMILPMMRSY
jgi:hypothetical protein